MESGCDGAQPSRIRGNSRMEGAALSALDFDGMRQHDGTAKSELVVSPNRCRVGGGKADER